ncbi:glycosyltransferase family 4 protein [Klebsiella quasipneumoniae]|uniref:glycosyltransferase family 4 protein n=1 Tax=Klebsiella quasipneumoniae TaxID=1463165 RepID=UPI000C7E729D|nr:glycosyltransferase family 4 protein [Klebsiella quasipneumoniae]PLF81507.1 hypothetical protein B6I98_27135 [Klebsiella quasipneumoniae]PLJ69668.1 hypothetical protein B6J71_19690 [Klebsiella quasipneumoniae]
MIIIHEYGEPSHYLGAIYENEFFDKKVKFYEFSTLRLILRSIKRKRYDLARKAVKDFFLLSFAFLFPTILNNKYVIIGMAPLDYRILFFNRILKHAHVTYHSSWLIWDGSKYPKGNKYINKYLKKKWDYFLNNIANSFAVVTETVKEQLIKHMGVHHQKIEVVYHSYDEEVFFARDESETQKKTINVIYVGRFIPNKGISNILELAKENKNINFYFIGKGSEDLKIKDAENKCENIFNIGYLSDKEKLAYYYNQADFILLPSKRTKDWEELFGMVIIEAMACGCIPICSDHNGPKIILNKTSWHKNLIKEDDYTVEANKLLQRYTNDLVLFNEDKRMAIETAAAYGKKTIAAIWHSVFIKAGRKK